MSNTMSTTLTDTVIVVAGEDTVPVDDPENLGDFLIFRVDVLDDGSPYHRELADQSALESAATGYADLMAACEREPGIHYEVRSAATGGLIHTTEPAPEKTPKRTPKSPLTSTPKTAGLSSESAKRARGPRSMRREAPCNGQPNQPHQLRMAIS